MLIVCITAWSRLLLEKLILTQLVKKFLLWNLKFITVSTRAHSSLPKVLQYNMMDNGTSYGVYQ
jgi:hypothetical protein